VISIPVTISSDVYQCFLHGDENGVIQSDPPLLGGPLHNAFPFLFISDSMYVSEFIHECRDLLISLGEHISQAHDGIYLFKTRFLNSFLAL
jgi:hypothetical protein